MGQVKYNWKAGDKYGLVELTGKSIIVNKNRHVEYICKCGKIGWTRLSHLMSGATKSCGCEAIRKTKIRERTHGMYGTSLYNVYRSMIQRCYDHNSEAYKNYGEKGVRMCSEWKENFLNFYNWAMSNGYRKGLELDKDKLSPYQTGLLYCPKFCCFITKKENMQNTSLCKMIEYKGRIKNLSSWCEELNLNYKMVWSRIYHLNWDINKSFETKSSKNGVII